MSGFTGSGQQLTHLAAGVVLQPVGQQLTHLAAGVALFPVGQQLTHLAAGVVLFPYTPPDASIWIPAPVWIG